MDGMEWFKTVDRNEISCDLVVGGCNLWECVDISDKLGVYEQDAMKKVMNENTIRFFICKRHKIMIACN